MKVTVLGATGTAGRSAVPLFVEAGHQVDAHVRSESGAASMATVGARPVRADIENTGELARLLTGSEAVVDLRVAIPPASRAALPWAWRDYVHLRDVEAGRVVDAAVAAGVPRVVHDTVTMVYADGGDRVLDEESTLDAPGPLAANLAAERHLARLTAAGGAGVALRFGQFYGPSDAFSAALMRSARRGRVPLVGASQGWTSAIHTDDVGHALLMALEAPAGIYNVVDDEPLRRQELVALLAGAAGVERVRTLPAWASTLAPGPVRALARSHRVTAARYRDLGWRPTVPSRRQGWPQAFATGSPPR